MKTRSRLACLLAVLPVAASAETVNLVTYYPAPSGVYAQLRSTENTFPSRDSGRVGIGTINPAAKLHVEQPGAAADAIIRAGFNRNATLQLLEASNPNFGAALRYYGDVNDRLSFVVGAPPVAERMTIMRGSGYVGIGTNSPAAPLSVQGLGGSNVDLTVNGRLRTGDNSSAGGVWLSNGWNMFVGQNCSGGTCDNVGFWTAGMGWNTMLLKQNGSVGIGTQTPLMVHDDNDRVLDVRGDVCGWNWWGHRLCIGGDSWGNDVELAIYDNAGAPSNNIAFYNARRNQFADTFARSFNVASSRRFKENIRPIDDALAKVSKLKGVYFDYASDKKPGLGLVAEEVAEVFPEAVERDADGKAPRSIDYARLVGALVEAIKAQQAEIDALEKRIEGRAKD
jgi:hypothetical protein